MVVVLGLMKRDAPGTVAADEIGSSLRNLTSAKSARSAGGKTRLKTSSFFQSPAALGECASSTSPAMTKLVDEYSTIVPGVKCSCGRCAAATCRMAYGGQSAVVSSRMAASSSGVSKSGKPDLMLIRWPTVT